MNSFSSEPRGAGGPRFVALKGKCARRSVSAFVSILVCACILTPTRQVRADPVASIVTIFLWILAEPIIPDLRLEFGGDREEVGVDMVWPIPINILHFPISDDLFGAVTIVAEPHYQVTDDVFRGVFLAQVPILFGDHEEIHAPQGFGVRLEGGGVVGQDGDGVVVGGGLMAGNGFLGLCLSYRFTHTDERDWHDVSLDLQLSLPLHLMATVD